MITDTPTKYPRAFRPTVFPVHEPAAEWEEDFWSHKQLSLPRPDVKSNALLWLFAHAPQVPVKLVGLNFLATKRLIASGLKNIALEGAINESENLLDLQPDWDEAGSPAIDRATWQRAVDLLREVCWHPEAELPRILPGPEGSIDLHWKTKRHEILVNVPADPEKPCDFYGDNYGKFSVKGTFHPNESIPALAILLHDYALACRGYSR